MKFENKKLRHELKYYINYQVYHTLRMRLQNILTPDPNMPTVEGYLISSLYFDDMYHSALRDKNAGVSFRKKFRIRTYERKDSKIKLECKMKYQEYIAKTSANLSRDEYDRILVGDYDFLLNREEEICKKLFLYNRSRLMKPTVVVEYQREAYIAAAGNVRITFDKNLSSSSGNIDVFSDKFITKRILDQDIMVMEVKYDEFLPSHIRAILQTGMTDMCAISKYVLCREEKGRLLYR